MRPRICTVTLIVALIFGSVTPAAERPLEPLKTWSAPGYTILAREETTARAVADNLAVIESVLSRLLDRAKPAQASMATVILLPRADWRRFLRTDAAQRPDLMPDASATYLLLPSDITTARLRSAVFHQGAHLFLRRHFDAKFPLWFDEGFALLAQGTRIEGGQAIVGAQHFSLQRPKSSTLPNTQIDRAARSITEDLNEWTPLDRLLRARELSDSIKRGSWAMVHKGLVADPGFGLQLFAYVQARSEPRSVEEAVQLSFGMNIAELDRSIHRYLEREDFADSRISFTSPARVTLTAGSTLSANEALALVSRAAEDSHGF